MLCCDFLKLNVTSQTLPDSDEAVFADLRGPVSELPGASFHVVVFSLLLEYLPSCEQRWRCCHTAHRLLMTNGLLLVITPDSHHQNKNVPMMKSWKQALEQLGFHRCRYEKQTHLHCMAFRKLSDVRLSSEASSHDSSLLYIPQDFSDDATRKVTSQSEDKTVTLSKTEYNCDLMDFGDLDCFD